MQVAHQQKAVNDLRDDILFGLSHEPPPVQIRVAFAVLLQVIFDGSISDANSVRDELLELQRLMRMVQP
jgi:hypothetical protein